MNHTNNDIHSLNRIHYLEPLARNGDLIAFHEWKLLTGNHDGVDIGELD